MNEDRITPLLSETPLTAAKAARACGVTVAAVVRWIREGKVIEGERVKLEGFPAGRGWMTTEQALARFLTVQAHAKGAPITPEPPSFDERRIKAGMERYARARQKFLEPRDSDKQ